MSNYSLFELGQKALITNSQGEILLLKRLNNKVMQGFYWDFPGGLLEQGEDIKESLKREVMEETGIDDLIINEFFYAVITDPQINLNNAKRILFIYKCSSKTQNEIKISDEHVDYGWFSPTITAKYLKTRYGKGITNQIINL